WRQNRAPSGGGALMAVDTKRVKGRRTVRYSSYEELLDDVRALATSPTRQLGNWSLGQICEHLSLAMASAIDGPSFQPSWLVRRIGPFFKKRVLTRGMPPGFRLPKNATRLIPTNNDASAGMCAMEKQIARLQQIAERKPHAVFGALSREEWD